MRAIGLFVILNLFSQLSLTAQEQEAEEGVSFENLEEALDENLGAKQKTNTHRLIPAEEVKTTRAYQTEALARRSFDEKKWKEVVGEVTFDEEKRNKAEKPEEKGDKERAQDKYAPWSGPLLKFISYLVIIGIVILLVYFIIKNISVDLHIQRSVVEDRLEKPVENIEVIDIETLLDNASKEGNLKLAVRLHYLRLLKQLHSHGIISWKKDKTNRDYLMEVFLKNIFFDEIRLLTLSYESIWYGEHAVASEDYKELASRFDSVHQSIHATRTQ